MALSLHSQTAWLTLVTAEPLAGAVEAIGDEHASAGAEHRLVFILRSARN